MAGQCIAGGTEICVLHRWLILKHSIQVMSRQLVKLVFGHSTDLATARCLELRLKSTIFLT